MRKKLDIPEVSNADLKHMLDQTMIRFENWRVEVEQKPNPKLVHSLKNIVSIIDTVTSMSEERMEYSYKELVIRMASLMTETASLNSIIVSALSDDDTIDAEELKKISDSLFSLINAAAELARLVQDKFSSPELISTGKKNLLPVVGSSI